MRPSRFAPSAAVAVALAAGGCAPFDAPLDTPLQRLADRATAPLDTGGSGVGTPDPTPVEDATRAFVADAADRSMPGDPVAVALDELREAVLRNNLDLRVVRFDPQAAEESLNAERAKFDSVFVASAGFRDDDRPLGNSTLFGISSPDPAISGTAGVFTELEQDRELLEAQVGLDVPLPTGGAVRLRQGVEIDDKSAAGLRSTEDRSATRFSISQPLLRGAGLAVNTASIRIAGLSLGVSEAETKLTAIRVLADAEKAYWRQWAAQRVLEVQREQLGLAQSNLTLVRRLIEEGATAPVERFSAELAVAQQLEAVVVAETALRLRARELARILNRPDLPVGAGVAIDATTDPVLLRFDIDRDALIERAFAERVELLALELELAADSLRIDLARNAALPVFAVEFEFGLGDRRGSVASAFADSFDFENTSVAVGGRFAVPVTNDAAEARVRRSVLGRAQRLASLDQRRLAIRQEVHDAADVLEQNWQRILAARQNVIAATANYEADLTLLTDGLRNAQDVLVALQQLGAARQREVRVIAEYQAAQIDLAFATGVLLGRSGTEIDAP